MHKSLDKEVAIKYLSLIGSCYYNGDFEPLYPYLSDDCVWESQWRLTPETGKFEVIRYFNKKGEILRNSDASLKWMIVELINNMNPINSNAVINGEKKQNVKMALFYPNGELALFMDQLLRENEHALSMLRIQVDENGLIKRMDMCMPELFQFRRYELPEE